MRRVWLIAASVVVALVAGGLLVYMRHEERETKLALVERFGGAPSPQMRERVRGRVEALLAQRRAQRDAPPAADEPAQSPTVARTIAEHPELVRAYLAQLELVAASSDEVARLVQTRTRVFEELVKTRRNRELPTAERDRQILQLFQQDQEVRHAVLGDERASILDEIAEEERIKVLAASLRKQGLEQEAREVESGAKRQ